MVGMEGRHLVALTLTSNNHSLTGFVNTHGCQTFDDGSIGNKCTNTRTIMYNYKCRDQWECCTGSGGAQAAYVIWRSKIQIFWTLSKNADRVGKDISLNETEETDLNCCRIHRKSTLNLINFDIKCRMYFLPIVVNTFYGVVRHDR